MISIIIGCLIANLITGYVIYKVGKKYLEPIKEKFEDLSNISDSIQEILDKLGKFPFKG